MKDIKKYRERKEKISQLASEINNFMFEFDVYSYRDNIGEGGLFKNSEEFIEEIEYQLVNNQEFLIRFFQSIVDENVTDMDNHKSANFLVRIKEINL